VKSDCCSKPFFAFVTKDEKERITQFIISNKLDLNIDDIFIEFTVSGSSKSEVFYKIYKKDDGHCIFLKNDKSCAIQSVKPLDCQFFPLTFDYMPDSDEIIIYLGECVAVEMMRESGRLNAWIDTEFQLIFEILKKYSKSELIAYSSLTGAPILNPLRRISMNQT